MSSRRVGAWWSPRRVGRRSSLVVVVVVVPVVVVSTSCRRPHRRRRHRRRGRQPAEVRVRGGAAAAGARVGVRTGLGRLVEGDRDEAVVLVGGRALDLRHHRLQEPVGGGQGGRAPGWHGASLPVGAGRRDDVGERRRGARALHVLAELADGRPRSGDRRRRRSASGSRGTGCARPVARSARGHLRLLAPEPRHPAGGPGAAADPADVGLPRVPGGGRADWRGSWWQRDTRNPRPSTWPRGPFCAGRDARERRAVGRGLRGGALAADQGDLVGKRRARHRVVVLDELALAAQRRRSGSRSPRPPKDWAKPRSDRTIRNTCLTGGRPPNPAGDGDVRSSVGVGEVLGQAETCAGCRRGRGAAVPAAAGAEPASLARGPSPCTTWFERPPWSTGSARPRSAARWPGPRRSSRRRSTRRSRRTRACAMTATAAARGPGISNPIAAAVGGVEGSAERPARRHARRPSPARGWRRSPGRSAPAAVRGGPRSPGSSADHGPDRASHSAHRDACAVWSRGLGCHRRPSSVVSAPRGVVNISSPSKPTGRG